MGERRTARVATDARGGAGGAAHEPSLAELQEALARCVDPAGNVPARVGDELAREQGWNGRLVDVLRLFTASERRTAYLAGGRRPEEILRWMEPWVEVPLSIGELPHVVTGGGWDREPCVHSARAGLLERVLKARGGAPRRIHGERAGAWLSDECALAGPAEIVALVRAVLDEGPVRSSAGDGNPPG